MIKMISRHKEVISNDEIGCMTRLLYQIGGLSRFTANCSLAHQLIVHLDNYRNALATNNPAAKQNGICGIFSIFIPSCCNCICGFNLGLFINVPLSVRKISLVLWIVCCSGTSHILYMCMVKYK